MRNSAGWAAISTLAIGLAACGKYGPPVRAVPQRPPQATESEPVEEEALERGEFEDAGGEEEAGP